MSADRCPRCVATYGEIGRPENFASDPICAFSSGVFSSHNWNCSTANALRDISGDPWEPSPFGHFAWTFRGDDSSFGAFWVPEHGEEGVFFVAMSWYKNRGATGQIWMFCDDMQPRPLTLTLAEHAITAVEALRARQKAREAR